MSELFSVEAISGYHAHIYYQDDVSREQAEWLRKKIVEHFDVNVGSWCDVPVGPHPSPMFQVLFSVSQFPHFVPWLMEQRGPLDILVHMCSPCGDYFDHTQGALWLGTSHPLKLYLFDDGSMNAENAVDN